MANGWGGKRAGAGSKPGPRRHLRKQVPEDIFLEILREGMTPTEAAKACGVGRSTLYRRRNEDEEFRKAWDEAADMGVDRLEDEARRRAVDGVLRPIYQGGKRVGSERVYSDRLLELLLKGRRPERFRERLDLSGKLNHSHQTDLSKLNDEQLDALAGLIQAATATGGDPGGEAAAGAAPPDGEVQDDDQG